MKRFHAGHTLVEIVLMMVLLGIIAGIGIPRCWELVQEYRLRGASLYMRGLLRQVRARAAAKNCYMGIVFDEDEGQPSLSIHIDGNHNGIRRADIRSGVDERVRGPWRMKDVFPGVRYGSPPSGAQPPFPGLRIGRSKIISFSPIGTSTTGTLFLSNDHGSVHAVVLLGTTGRVRLARFRGGRWEPMS
jgi:type II secretory pathway pseudopilin PulG